ncbi:MmcQ/YjbR family DNA-binding protein [Phenylobacterium sp.]|uniref:MmcQ/YjbR family DNA-binding protein n=1 Tax=Phenylobacterium sp. TaxID=1871053 RepID=UPI002DF3FF03|nr:MmcQ/YjbR family DNA-binding protein [Phenylobacterium sp.]
MTKDELHAAALALPGATMNVQWGDDHIYKVGGKIFVGCDGAYRTLTVKATEIAFEALTASGRATPSRYTGRHGWITFHDLAALDAEEVRGWLKTSHDLVSANLTKAQKNELGLA